ncbi:MAG TPA: hypothetical protein VFY13_08370 [Luteolibacter sp.]|nr:hypothetical protein [Luteolibacter sp.]
MLNPIQRKLEIGSHSERLRAVRELGEIHTREAYALLQLAAEDIDPQIQDEARRLMRESVWDNGSGSSSRHSAPTHAIEEGLFG